MMGAAQWMIFFWFGHQAIVLNYLHKVLFNMVVLELAVSCTIATCHDKDKEAFILNTMQKKCGRIKTHQTTNV